MRLIHVFNQKSSGFVSVLIIAFAFMIAQSSLAVWKARAAPPGFGHVDFEGLYTVGINQTDRIEGKSFTVYGSLVIEHNATLILNNARVQIFRPPQLYGSPTIKNGGKLIIQNSFFHTSRLESEQDYAGSDSVLLDEGAQLDAVNSRLLDWVTASDRTQISISNSTVGLVKSPSTVQILNSSSDWVEILEGASFSITNSSIDVLVCRRGSNSSLVHILDSHVNDLSIEETKADVRIDGSTIDWLDFHTWYASSISVSNSTLSLSLSASRENLTWTVKPFFAEEWNVYKDTPFRSIEGNLTLTETNVTKVALSFLHSHVFLLDSELYGLLSKSSKTYIINSRVEKSLTAVSSSVYVVDSTGEEFDGWDSNATIIDSAFSRIEAQRDSVIEVWQRLTVVVSDQAANPKSDTVVKIADSEGTLIDEGPVNTRGIIQFSLLEKRITSNQTTFVGNYVIRAVYDSWSAETSLDLSDKQTVFITVLPLNVRLMIFFTSPVGIALLFLLVLIAIGVILLIRKRVLRSSKPSESPSNA